jgi:uncharacterized membrane protein
MFNDLLAKAIRMFKIFGIVVAISIICAYIFSIKFLGIIIMSALTVFLINKMIIGLAILALVIAVAYVLNKRS